MNEVSSSHRGSTTNPASAVLAGFEVAEVDCVNHGGLITVELIDQVIAKYGAERVAGIMLTNPSTLGTFEEHITEVAARLHEIGALLYYDGANLNALMGLARPGDDLLAWLAFGDSHVFAVDTKGAREVGAADSKRLAFLGSPAEDRDSLADRSRAGTESLVGVEALVLATDGLSEKGIGVEDPAAAVAEAWEAAGRETPAGRSLAAARGLAECALASHARRRSGDNIATARVR